MLIFEKLNLVNYVTWKELDFQFEQGVSFISGANYSGKSTIFSFLQPLLYDASGDIPHGATTSFSFIKEDNYHTLGITKANKNTFSILENDIDLAIHKITTAREYIFNTFKLSIDLFNTTILLNGRKDHPLASGKPASRLDYLLNTLTSSLVYEEYSSIIDKKHKELSKSLIEIKTLKTTLDSLKEPSLPEKIDNLEEQLTFLSKAQHNLNTQLEQARKIQDLGNIPLYKGQPLSIDEAKSIKKRIDTRFNSVKGLSPEKTDKLRKAKNTFDKLASELAVPSISIPALLPKIRAKIDNLSVEIEETKLLLSKMQEQESLLPFKGIKPKLSIEETNKKITILKDRYNHAKVVTSNDIDSEDTCPICLSKHDMKSIISNANETIKTFKSKLAKLEEQLAINKAYTIKFIENIPDLDTLTSKMRKLNALEASASILEGEDLSFLDSKIDLEKVEKDKYLIDLFIFSYEKHETGIKQQLEENNPYVKSNIEHIIKKLNNKLLSINDEIDSLKSRAMRYEIQMESYTNWRNQTKSIKNQIKEYDQVSFDLEVIKGLKAAFSRDGFRLYKLQMLTDLFVSNLNSLVPILVQEPIKFEAELDKRKCDILATRNGRKSSIFSLSGAESQIFKIISALALIRCLPASYRADTIILDEIEANGDERFVTSYARDFIPEIRKSVNKVIVVSPKTIRQLPLQPDRAFIVEKKYGKSAFLT